MDAYCTRCEQWKTLSSFATSCIHSKCGTRGRCRDCESERLASYYASHKEECRTYQAAYRESNLTTIKQRKREYERRNRDRLNAKRRARRRANPQAEHERGQKERQINPHRTRTRRAVNNAVRDGRLVKPARCRLNNENCSGQIEAHHPDYNKPLDVMWLCVTHHAAWHASFAVED